MTLPHELLTFFTSYMDDAADILIEAMHKEDRTALMMLDQIHKFINLAKLAGELERSTEQIQAFFYVSLLDTLYNLHHPGTRFGSKRRITAFFDEFLAEDERTFKFGIQRSLADDEIVRERGCHLSRLDLVTLLYDLRCAFTHEGVSSELHYARDGYDAMCRITHQNGRQNVYEVKMTFEEFRDVFIRMGLRCMRLKLSNTV